MEIKSVEIAKVYPTEVWFEKDIMGTVSIKMQHMAPNVEPFTFIQIHYDYAYTSNSHQRQMVESIAKLLGVDSIQERPWQVPDAWLSDKDQE